MITEKEEILNNAIKSQLKINDMKSRGGIQYKVIGDWFIQFLIYIKGVNKDMVSITVRIKPMSFDDTFWEVFEMKSNRTKPTALRANGAFALDGYVIYENDFSFTQNDQIQGIVEVELMKENSSIELFLIKLKITMIL